MVSLMVFGHVSAFIFFCSVGLPGDEQPAQRCAFLRRAVTRYFLPVAQFLRAAQGLKCCPFNSSGDSRLASSDEARVEALYAIVSATTDGGPLFMLQYLVLGWNTSGYGSYDTFVLSWKPGRLLVLSLCLSAVSAAWNVTRAIVFLVPLRSSLRSLSLSLAAGAFTLSALLVRCTSLASILGLQLLFLATNSTHSWDHFCVIFFVTLGIYLLLIVPVPLIGYYFLSRGPTSDINCSPRYSRSKSMLKAVAFTYVNISFGPLYPFMSLAKTIRISTTRFQIRLCFFAMCRWIFEVCLMLILVIKKWTVCQSFKHYNIHYPMMPCPLYVSALASGLVIGISSQLFFQKLAQTSVQTQAAGTKSS